MYTDKQRFFEGPLGYATDAWQLSGTVQQELGLNWARIYPVCREVVFIIPNWAQKMLGLNNFPVSGHRS